MYGSDSGIGGGTPGGRPGGSGGSGGGLTPGYGSTSAQNNDTWGKAIQVVYGCATVKGVPLMLYTVTGQETGDVALDGATTGQMDVAIVQFGLAIGEVASVDGIVYYDRLYGPAAIAGHQVDWDYLSAGPASFAPTFPLGDVATASEWSALSAMADDYRIPFGHLATLRCERMGLPDGPAKPPELKAIVSGFFSDRNNAAREAYLGDHWTINDANPADVIRDLIENTRYGLGFPAGTVIVDVGSNGLASSSYETYCDAFGLWIALGVDETVQVANVIAQILLATNAVGFWEGNSFKVVPLGDIARTANGATYTPVSTALAIDDDVLILEGENPVQIRRTPLVDTFNAVPVLWSRDTILRDVEMVTTEVPDTANVELFGMRRADPVELPCIRTLAHAQFIAKILTERSLYARDVWEFSVNPRAAAVLQVGDMVALTHEAIGADEELLRIIETDEDERGQLAVKAVKWLSSTAIEVKTLPAVPDGMRPHLRILVRRGTGVNSEWDDISNDQSSYTYRTNVAGAGAKQCSGVFIGFEAPFSGLEVQADRDARWDDDAEAVSPCWWWTTPGPSEQFSRGDTGAELAWLSADDIFSRVYYPSNNHDAPIASCTAATINAGNALDPFHGNPIGRSRWAKPVDWAPGLDGFTLHNWPAKPGDDEKYWVLANNQECAMTFTRGDIYNDARSVKYASIMPIL